MSKRNTKKDSSEKVNKQRIYEFDYSQLDNWHDDFDESIVETYESIEDLGFPTAQPAPDDASPVCQQRILWSHRDPLGRSFEFRSLWHWTHGYLIPFGNGMMAACDELGNRMTFIRLN